VPKVSATAIATGLFPKPVGASNSMYDSFIPSYQWKLAK